jgi:hypothetical protein
LASSDFGDARLPAACEGADEVERRTADSMVVAAVCFACRRAARVRLKSAGAAEIELEFWQPGGMCVCEIAREERGGRAVFMGGSACARG